MEAATTRAFPLELHEALQQISDIRGQMVRGTVFRGYRSITVGFSGILAIVAAFLQDRFVGTEPDSPVTFVFWWSGVAAVSVAFVAVELLWRSMATGPGLSREMTRSAVLQFSPCVFVGALMTIVICQDAPQVGWMLPGLWALLFSIGVFGSLRLLPRSVAWVGVFYAICGLACLRFGQQQSAYSPWLMGITFGGGQLLGAAVLFWTLERRDRVEKE